MKYANEGFPKYFRVFAAVMSVVPVIAGLCALQEMLIEVDRWREAQDWVEVEARIVHASWRTNVSARGRKTFESECRYRYRFQGADYVGQRVGLFDHFTDIGDRQQKTLRMLRRAKNQNQAIPCFVNPADPSDAVLSRHFEAPLIGLDTMLVLFAFGAGLTILLVMVWEIRRAVATQNLQMSYPRQPWRWKVCWEERAIRQQHFGVPALFWVCGSYFTLAAAPFTILTLPEILQHGCAWEMYVVSGVAVSAGPVTLLASMYVAIDRRRFGRTHLSVGGLPVVPGGEMFGYLVIRPVRGFLSAIEATLECTRIRAVPTPHSRSKLLRRNGILEVGPSKPGQEELCVPFSFGIPEEAPPFDESDPLDQIEWALSLKAKTEVGRFRQRFLIPVFHRSPEDSEPLDGEELPPVLTLGSG
jgi:hypothetical protein